MLQTFAEIILPRLRCHKFIMASVAATDDSCPSLNTAGSIRILPLCVCRSLSSRRRILQSWNCRRHDGDRSGRLGRSESVVDGRVCS